MTSPVFPAAAKTNDPSQYQAGEIFMYDEYSYYDLDMDMINLRIETPSTKGSYTSFKAPVSQAKA